MSDADVRNILSDDAIERLRAGYDREAMWGGARTAVVLPFPPTEGWLDFLGNELYDPEVFDPAQRERVLIGIFAGRPDDLTLSVHTYWGLVEGLSVDEISRTLVLAGMYTGIGNYTISMGIFRKTLATLKGLCDDGDGPIGVGPVFQALVASR